MNSYSKECQDLFILSVLNKKTNGPYVEIGAAHAINENNTYLLESEFDWRGISFEIDSGLASSFSVRKNPCICTDATLVDYTDLFEKYNLGNHIDYLQLDIDPPAVTLSALKKIDFTKFSFSVITFEHDAYQESYGYGGEYERLESRRILESYGYTRVITNVTHKGLEFEDWYINESYMPNDNWKAFIGNNIELKHDIANADYLNKFNNFLN